MQVGENNAFKDHNPHSIGFYYARQSAGKEDEPELPSWNFPALMDLDIAVNRQLYNNRSGLSQELRDMEDEEHVIPEYFEQNDPRKPAKLYVKDRLDHILSELFITRRKLEKHLSQSELVAYDSVLAKYLTHDALYGKLKREIGKDLNEI